MDRLSTRPTRPWRITVRVARYALLAFIILVFYANTVVEQSAHGSVYDRLDDTPYNSVGLLLGTARFQPGGGVNPFFEYRIDAAVALFEAGKIHYILASGDNRHPSYNEPAAMLDALLQRGIPQERIVLDYAGINTFDSVQRARYVFGQRRLTVISQRFHVTRALYLAEQQGVDAVGFRARDVQGEASLRMTVREYLSRTKAVLDVHLLRRNVPRFPYRRPISG